MTLTHLVALVIVATLLCAGLAWWMGRIVAALPF
jgi:hypothetical protein